MLLTIECPIFFCKWVFCQREVHFQQKVESLNFIPMGKMIVWKK